MGPSKITSPYDHERAEGVKRDDYVYVALTMNSQGGSLPIDMLTGRPFISAENLVVVDDSLSASCKRVFDNCGKQNPYPVYIAKGIVDKILRDGSSIRSQIACFPASSIHSFANIKFYKIQLASLKGITNLSTIFKNGHVAIVNSKFRPPEQTDLNKIATAINKSYHIVDRVVTCSH